MVSFLTIRRSDMVAEDRAYARSCSCTMHRNIQAFNAFVTSITRLRSVLNNGDEQPPPKAGDIRQSDSGTFAMIHSNLPQRYTGTPGAISRSTSRNWQPLSVA